VRQERAAAVSALESALAQYFQNEIVPRVAELEKNGNWRKARALLTTEARAWIDGVPARRDGLSENELNEAVARLQSDKISVLRAGLDDAWSAVDAGIVTFVAERMLVLRAELTARSLVDAPARLRREVLAELETRKVKLGEMPTGLLHLGHEALSNGETELRELEARLALEDAQRGLTELDAEQDPAWKLRRYEDARAAYAAALEQPWLAPVRATIELRTREAQLLQDLLERAARAVNGRTGQRMDLRAGSILVSGPVSKAEDPLRSGFVITLDSGLSYSFALRPPDAPTAGTGPAVLSTETILQLAGVANDDAGSKTSDRLLRALFFMREGDAARSRAIVNGGPLPRNDVLVNELEERLRVDLAHVQEQQGERRAEALERLRLVRREARDASNSESHVKRIEGLLADRTDVLSDEELRELRRMRDDWYARNQKPLAEPTVASVFAPTVLEELSGARVRMRFVFDEPAVGAFERGSWLPEGLGWSAVRYAKSDEDLLTRASPTLALKEPLRIQNEPLDVRLRLDQRPDSPPDLVLVSIAGFHAVFLYQPDGSRGVCVVDTTDPSRVLARARRGEGREIPGWKLGTQLELHLVVRRASGVIAIEVDGRRVDEFKPPAPRTDPLHATLQVRSWQPMKLLSATIEASRK
jgi:hypothetical protein